MRQRKRENVEKGYNVCVYMFIRERERERERVEMCVCVFYEFIRERERERERERCQTECTYSSKKMLKDTLLFRVFNERKKHHSEVKPIKKPRRKCPKPFYNIFKSLL